MFAAGMYNMVNLVLANSCFPCETEREECWTKEKSNSQLLVIGHMIHLAPGTKAGTTNLYEPIVEVLELLQVKHHFANGSPRDLGWLASAMQCLLFVQRISDSMAWSWSWSLSSSSHCGMDAAPLGICIPGVGKFDHLRDSCSRQTKDSRGRARARQSSKQSGCVYLHVWNWELVDESWYHRLCIGDTFDKDINYAGQHHLQLNNDG